jgi:hypothetical protein
MNSSGFGLLIAWFTYKPGSNRQMTSARFA